MLIWILWANYSIYLWWTTPALPDGSHVMEWSEHGRTHYLTVDQHRFYSHFETAAFSGLVAFFVLSIGGALLYRSGGPSSDYSTAPGT